MDINQLADKAADLRQNHGYNCCQAVTAVLAEDVGLKPDDLNLVAAGFAGGMGNMEGTCGSLIGAVMVAGMKTGGRKSVLVARDIADRFKEKSGAVRCRDLKGIDTGAVLCPCQQCVRNAVVAYGELMEGNE